MFLWIYSCIYCFFNSVSLGVSSSAKFGTYRPQEGSPQKNASGKTLRLYNREINKRTALSLSTIASWWQLSSLAYILIGQFRVLQLPGISGQLQHFQESPLLSVWSRNLDLKNTWDRGIQPLPSTSEEGHLPFPYLAALSSMPPTSISSKD